jgi:putative hydrolase of the HAD superfamily
MTRPRRSLRLVVFDGDDTLWKTQELYDAAKLEFAALMRELSLSAPDPIALLEYVDMQAVDSQGFTIDRFENSMVATYRILCAKRAIASAEVVEERIRQLTRRFRGGYELYPDTISTLEALSTWLTLVLATKGEPAIQEQKVTNLGLTRFFNRVYVFTRKTTEEYLRVLADFSAPPETAIAIGNSARSDINPATDIGMAAILITRPTWHYEKEALRNPERVRSVNSLTEAAASMMAMRTHDKAST